MGNVAYLGQHNNHRPLLSKVDRELRAMVVCRPWNIHTSPLLRHSPLGSEKTGSVEMLILAEQIIIRDPEHLSEVKSVSLDRTQGNTECLQEQRTPSLPNLWPSNFIHSGVHCSDPSLQAPLHSFFPHGFLKAILASQPALYLLWKIKC